MTSMPSSMRGDAGGQQLGRALDLDQAQPAGAHVDRPSQVAERRNEDVVLAGNFENGLILAGAEIRAIDLQRLDRWVQGS